MDHSGEKGREEALLVDQEASLATEKQPELIHETQLRGREALIG